MVMLYLPTTRHKPSSNDHRQENILPAVGMLFYILRNKSIYKSCIFFFTFTITQFKDRKVRVTPTSQVHASVML
jgi:hypothetical protein